MAVHQITVALMQVVVLLYTLTEVTDANCVEKLEAAGAIGDTVQFHLCDKRGYFMSARYIYVTIDDDIFFIEGTGIWKNGWLWDFDEHFNVDIHLKITSEENFGTARVNVYYYGGEHVSVFHSGPPELCNKTIEPTQTLAAFFWVPGAYFVTSTIKSTLCILNLDDTLRADLTVEKQSSIVAAESSLSSSFNVTVQSGTGRYHEQELVFEVANMTEADVGNWTVRVDNTYGYLIIDVVIETIELRPPPSANDGTDASAIGLGLTSVVIVIAIVVGVVWAIRMFRGKDKTETALSNSGNTTEIPAANHTTHVNVAYTSGSEITKFKSPIKKQALTL